MEDIKQHISRGNEAMKQVNYEEAIKHFKLALEIEKHNRIALDRIVFLFLQTNKNEEAHPFIDRKLEIDPENPYALVDKGICYYNQKKYPEALEYYNKGLELSPTTGNFLDNIGLVYYDQEDYEEALKYFKRAREVDPTYAPALISICYVLVKQKKYKEAIAQFEEAIEENEKSGYPDDPSIYCYRAKCYQELGNPDLCMQDIEKAADLFDKGIVGIMAGSLIEQSKKIINEVIQLENATKETQKVLDTGDKNDKAVQQVVEKFKALKEIKSKVVAHKIDDLQKTGETKVSEEKAQQERKKELLMMLEDNPDRVFELIIQYPEIYSYPETSMLIIKSMHSVQTQLATAQKQLSKHEKALIDGGVYDKASITQGFAEMQKNEPKVYEYNKVFYWTLLNYFTAARVAGTDMVQGNVDSVETDKEKLVMKGMKALTQIAGKVPFFSGITDTIDSLIDKVYGSVKERRFENKVNALNMIIINNKDSKAQREDDFNLCLAKVSLEVAKAKRKEILEPQPNQSGKFTKALEFINSMIENLKEKALGAKIDTYASEVACLALKDSMLLIAYFHKNHEAVLERTEEGLDLVILEIMTTGKAESILSDAEKNIQKELQEPKKGTKASGCCNVF